MADNILERLSPAELEREVAKLTMTDLRALPEKGKVFAALTELQGFNKLPESSTQEEVDKLIAEGATELQRGLKSTEGIRAVVFAKEMVEGGMYPGTLAAIGHGMYFAEPQDLGPNSTVFRRLSVIARDYAKGDFGGFIVRCALRKDAYVVDKDELYQTFLELRTRARKAGIRDLGSFAASLGIDAYFCDDVYNHTTEKVWVVVNRTVLTFQRIGLQIAPVKRQ